MPGARARCGPSMTRSGRHARRGRLRDRGRDVGDSGLRRQRRVAVAGVAEHAEHATQFGERLPSDGLDPGEHLGGLVRVGVDDLPSGGRLHGDDAHRVRHHVVHLTGDPAALAGDGTFGFGEAVGLGGGGAAFGVDEDPFAVADEHPCHDGARSGRRTMLSAVK